jgi:N-acetylmuramidase
MSILPFRCTAEPISPAGVQAAMTTLGVDSSTLWAMLTVETPGSGFLADRRPQILFERHIFHKITSGQFDAGNPDISNAQPGGYGRGGAAQYSRLGEAVALDEDAALQSASWGVGQVMGENFAMVGFASVNEMVAAMCDSEDAQLAAVVSFITSKGLQTALQTQDWATYAKGYNGPNYAQRSYDLHLATYYSYFNNGGLLPDLTIRAAQTCLFFLGFDPKGIDGLIGKNTLTALHEFQNEQGIPLTTGIDAGVMAILFGALPVAADLSLA